MKIGLALGGGGAKGFAHIGILNELDKAGITVDVIAGTSVGALVGAVYAAGQLSELEKTARGVKLTDIPGLLSPAWSLSGFFSGKNALEVLSNILASERIEDLRLPFAAISADLNSAEVVTMTSGNLQQALRASFSIPAIFTPIIVGDRILVDGGTLEPVPVRAARELGADFVIAVDLFGNNQIPRKAEDSEGSRSAAASIASSAWSYLKNLSEKLPRREGRESTPSGNIVSIIEQTLAIGQIELTRLRLRQYPPEVLIQPPVRDIGLLDFHRGTDGVARGAQAFKEQLSQIRSALEQFSTCA